ncbi:MAG: hypothetical protein IPF49_07205 [Gammaproteobacteria bacterium]|nr:hypothetical protein [Gammaproteobacteria bacterium]
MIACKPDFLLWPESAPGTLPIAVFLDGWQYHRNRIGDDIAKRMAIARSGRFTVWTLTAGDVTYFLDGGDNQPETPWAGAFVSNAGAAEAVCKRFEVGEHQHFHVQGAFAQLRDRLQGMDDDTLTRVGITLALRIGARPLQTTEFTSLCASEAFSRLQSLPRLPGRALPILVAAGPRPRRSLRLRCGAQVPRFRPCHRHRWIGVDSPRSCCIGATHRMRRMMSASAPGSNGGRQRICCFRL